MEVALGPGDIVLHGYPALPSWNGALQPSPFFQSMSIVAKRSPVSATAELLLYLCVHIGRELIVDPVSTFDQLHFSSFLKGSLIASNKTTAAASSNDMLPYVFYFFRCCGL